MSESLPTIGCTARRDAVHMLETADARNRS
jgi:hypothetical protein